MGEGEISTTVRHYWATNSREGIVYKALVGPSMGLRLSVPDLVADSMLLSTVSEVPNGADPMEE